MAKGERCGLPQDPIGEMKSLRRSPHAYEISALSPQYKIRSTVIKLRKVHYNFILSLD
jgi:hypothetical protein